MQAPVLAALENVRPWTGRGWRAVGGGGVRGGGWGRGGRTTFLRFSGTIFVQHFYPFWTSSVTVHETEHLHLPASFDKPVLYAQALTHTHTGWRRVCIHKMNSQNKSSLDCFSPVEMGKSDPTFLSEVGWLKEIYQVSSNECWCCSVSATAKWPKCQLMQL